MTLLLDTCTLLWMTFDPSRLSPAAAAALNHPASRPHVSALAAWEIGIKLVKDKLGLPQPVSQWFPGVVARYRLVALPISSHAAAASTELPPIHADPFDRVLIATALEHGLRIVTSDQIIPTYPGIRTLW
jgi:PIN domain nuclease of toxin-antitoxin system